MRRSTFGLLRDRLQHIRGDRVRVMIGFRQSADEAANLPLIERFERRAETDERFQSLQARRIETLCELAPPDKDHADRWGTGGLHRIEWQPQKRPVGQELSSVQNSNSGGRLGWCR